LVEIFNELDQDDDGFLQHTDIVRLDEICGRPVVLDDAGWLSLCKMVSCQDPKAGLTLTDMWQFYAQVGDDELSELTQAHSALFAETVLEQERKQTRSATKIQAAVRGNHGRKRAAKRFREADQERVAATKIQAQHRGKAGRKQVEQKKKTENTAATKVQAMQRGRAARRDIAAKQADEIRAMADRANKFAEEAEKKKLSQATPVKEPSATEESDAAAKIQAKVRGKQTRKTLSERRRAAVQLQSRQRGRAARGKFARLQKQEAKQQEQQIQQYEHGQEQQQQDPAAPMPATESSPGSEPHNAEPPPAPPKLSAQDMVAAIFAHYDTDQDGWLQHTDVSRLETETGDGGAIDLESWAGLCEILGADKKVVRKSLPPLPAPFGVFLYPSHSVLT
jgi:hypothetical protein